MNLCFSISYLFGLFIYIKNIEISTNKEEEWEQTYKKTC